MIGRLLRYSNPDPAMNEACEEALLLARLNDQPLDTVRLWQNNPAVLLGGHIDAEASLNLEECLKRRLPLIRRSTTSKPMYHDLGTLNLSYVMDQRRISSGTDLTSVYLQLCDPVARGLSKLGADAEVDEYGQSISASGGKVVQVGVGFYYELILFQVTVNVNTDLATMGEVLKNPGGVTSLSSVLDRPVELGEVEEDLIRAISDRFGIELEEQRLSPAEEALAQRLYRIKYSKEDWNLRMRSPLTLKDVLIDIYVAYPPTSRCKEVISNVNQAIAEVKDRVECRTWMRGKGLEGRGFVPAGVAMPADLIKAAKDALVPAVLINGKLAFWKGVPAVQELKSRLEQVLGGNI
ncbi:MAG: hypothetical protein QW390_03030 [Candidatus Bathyarchaeia archaeon]